MKHEPILYILMRTDLASLNAGKAVAQGSHAANQFVMNYEARISDSPSSSGPKGQSQLDAWREDRTFGTVLVLGVDQAQMLNCVAKAKEYDELFAEIVHDPTYPVRDGKVTHYIPLDTCAFVFGDKDDCRAIVGDLKLMP